MPPAKDFSPDSTASVVLLRIVPPPHKLVLAMNFGGLSVVDKVPAIVFRSLHVKEPHQDFELMLPLPSEVE